MKIAFGQGPYGVELTIRDRSFDEFAQFCSVPEQGDKHEAWFLRGGQVEKVESHTTSKGKKYGPGFYRKDKYLKSAEFLIIDGDSSKDDPKSAPPPKLVHEALKKLNIKHFLYTTHSHSKDVNKFRVVIPCRMSKKELQATARKIIQDLNDEDTPIKFVNEMKVWAQIWYLPTRDDPQDGLFEFYSYLEGDDYCAVDSLDAPEQAKSTGSSTSTDSLHYEQHMAEFLKTGEGHTHYGPMCQSLANFGNNANQIFKTLQPICKAIFELHKREWGDRDNNLMEAAETAVDTYGLI